MDEWMENGDRRWMGKMSVLCVAPGRLTRVSREKLKVHHRNKGNNPGMGRELHTNGKKKGIDGIKAVSWKLMNSESLRCRP